MTRRIRFTDVSKAFIKDQKQRLVTNLFESVIKDTPVDTGHLRANWNVSADAPDTGVRETTEDSTSRVAPFVQANVTEKDGSVFLSNGVPYGPVIEYHGGSPKNAPEGMVRLNLIKING